MLLLVALTVAIHGAPLGVQNEVLDRLDDDLDALVETDENSTVSPMDKLLNTAKEANDSEQRKKDKDPFKQRGTYTKEMKQYEKEEKWHKDHPKKVDGRKKKYDPLNDFKNPEDEKKRAAKIARDIYNIIKKPVAKKAEEIDEQRRIRLIKEKGKRDAKTLRRIRKAIVRRDRREKNRQRKDDRRMAQEKRHPKKAVKNRIQSTMASEDKKLEKDPPQASAAAIAAVEKMGQPARDKIAGRPPTRA